MSYGSPFHKAVFHAMPGPVRNVTASLYGYREKHRREGAVYQRYCQEAREYQRAPKERLDDICLRRMREFLAKAQISSPFHRERLAKAQVDPKTMTSLRDLERIPLLPKETLRSHIKDIISKEDAEGAHWVHTSGTTGLGLSFPETWDCFKREYAYRFQNYEEGGVRLGDRWAFCAGHPVAGPSRTRPPFWVRDWSNNWLLMSSAHLTERNAVDYIRELARFSPALIGGYPSSVYLLALANRQQGRPVRPKAVFTASETLMNYQREAMEDSFGCRPRSYYGNAERCGFFSECEHGVFHVRQEHSYMEVLKADGTAAQPGEEGTVVGTGYGNAATPLIRYVVGDVAKVSKLKTCPCGRTGLLLDEIVGRTEDYILTPDGRFVGRLDHLFKDASRVRMAQLYQDSPEILEIRIVKTPEFGAGDEKAILDEARLRLGSEIKIRFNYVEEIERTRAGKFRFVLSNIKDKRFLGSALK